MTMDKAEGVFKVGKVYVLVVEMRVDGDERKRFESSKAMICAGR